MKSSRFVLRYSNILFLILFFLLFSFPVSAAEKTIGVLMTGSIPYYKEIQKTFAETLEQGENYD